MGYIPGMDDAPELVQAGGQKAVYKATIDGTAVALKVIAIRTDLNEEEDTLEVSEVVGRAHREVEILSQVNVPVLTKPGPLSLASMSIEGTEWLYFTEEWINGQSLRDMVDEGKLPPLQIIRLGIDLIQAVSWLADHALVHRDIKPANIMWASDRSRFVLLDPGIALDLGAPSLTQFLGVVGTIGYLSPEQMDALRKRNLDFRSDLFAVGIVMYEAATGHHPFMSARTTPQEVLAGILTQNPEPIANRIENFPQTLSDIIGRLLRKAPHMRYRTCERALLAMEEVASSLENSS